MTKANSRILQIEAVDSSFVVSLFGEVKNMLAEINAKIDQRPPDEEYLSQGETAKLLKVHRMTVGEWDKAGILNGYRIGRKIRYKKSEVLAAMQIINNRKTSA